MAQLTNQQKEDIRLSRDIYCNLFDDEDAIVFVHEPEYRNFYVFGSIACRLNHILKRLGMERIYPTASIDSEFYFEIPDNHFYYLLSKLIYDDQKIQIL